MSTCRSYCTYQSIVRCQHHKSVLSDLVGQWRSFEDWEVSQVRLSEDRDQLRPRSLPAVPLVESCVQLRQVALRLDAQHSSLTLCHIKSLRVTKIGGSEDLIEARGRQAQTWDATRCGGVDRDLCSRLELAQYGTSHSIRSKRSSVAASGLPGGCCRDLAWWSGKRRSSRRARSTGS